MRCPDCGFKMKEQEAPDKSTEIWECPNCYHEEIIEKKKFKTKSEWKGRK